MNDLHNQIMFTEATREASEAIIRVAKKYRDSSLDLDNRATREAMAEMFQEGIKYAVKLIEAVGDKKPV